MYMYKMCQNSASSSQLVLSRSLNAPFYWLEFEQPIGRDVNLSSDFSLVFVKLTSFISWHIGMFYTNIGNMLFWYLYTWYSKIRENH